MSASDEKQHICKERTLLVGQQEGHLACKKTGRGMVEVGAG